MEHSSMLKQEGKHCSLDDVAFVMHRLAHASLVTCLT